MQTTYENFRYRYDKKDNPYHKGVKQNLVEVFLSPIPSPLIDFRGYIQEDDSIVMDPTSPNLGGTSKEKIDIEMGSSFAEASGISLPEILQHLHYEELEESMRSKEGNGITDSIPSPFLFEANDVVVERRKSEEKCDDGIITPETHIGHQV